MSQNQMKTNVSNVANFYGNRAVLITGGSGFLGKVLIEKLLRSCPGLKKIFVLMRPKRNKQPEERFQELFKEPLYDLVREDENLLRKVIMIEGDVTGQNLNMSDGNLSRVKKEVSVIFHVAATVKFDEPLKVAVDINVVGTKNIIELSRKLPRLAALVHVSTAYANCDRDEVDEHVYPVNIDPEDLIQISNWLDRDTLEELKLKLLDRKPNTYTYTKALSEWLLVKTARDLPVVICRPSIVIASWLEPLRGWIDNMNGPTGAHVAAGKGFLRSSLGEPSCIVDLIPVDIATNLLISSAWFAELYQYYKFNNKNEVNIQINNSRESTNLQFLNTQNKNSSLDRKFINSSNKDDSVAIEEAYKYLSTSLQNTNLRQDDGYASARESPNCPILDSITGYNSNHAVVSRIGYEKFDGNLKKFRNQNKLRLAAKKLPEEISDIPVFHCTSCNENPITWKKFSSLFIAACVIFPSITVYRYPCEFFRSNKLLNSFYRNTLQRIPAYMIHFMTYLVGGGIKFVKISMNLDALQSGLKKFCLNEWKFSNENFSMLRDEIMSTEDNRSFNCDIRTLNWTDYTTDYVLGVRKYVLKEPLDNLAEARKNLNFVYYRNLFLQISSTLLFLGFANYIKSKLLTEHNEK